MSRFGFLLSAVAAFGVACSYAVGADVSAPKSDAKADVKTNVKADVPADLKGDAKAPVTEAEKAKAAAPAAAEFSEEDTLAFAREHHPELADLLEKLKTKPTEYSRAIRQLNQARNRLSRVRRSSLEKYELSLAVWKLDSRIQLLGARMTMSDEASLEQQLKDLLAQRYDAKTKEVTYDRDQLAARLKKADEVVKKAADNRETALQSEYDRIMNVRTQKQLEAAEKTLKAKAKGKKAKSGAVSKP